MSYHIARDGQVSAGPFPFGMNNKARDHNLPEGTARNIVNGDLDDQGNVMRRDGSTKVYDGLGTRGGYGCPAGEYFVEGNTLRKLETDDSSHILYTGITGTTAAFDYFNGVVYFSDGVIGKKIIDDVVYPWGIEAPNKPIMSETDGALDPGTYLAAYCWVDQYGVESGASSYTSIKLEEAAGLKFHNLPGLALGASYLRIYLTTPNGKVFYHAANITTQSDYSIMAGSYDSGSVLSSAFIDPPPAGDIVCHYNGRSYISTGKVIYYSEGYAFDRFKLGTSFIQTTDDVQIMLPVTGGIFVATDKETFFYSGNPEDGFNVIPKFDYGGLYGTGLQILNSDEVLWMSQRGLIRGNASGQCENIQESNVATETGTSGAILLREQDGKRQIIAGIKNPTTSKLAASSFIEAEIIRRS